MSVVQLWLIVVCIIVSAAVTLAIMYCIVAQCGNSRPRASNAVYAVIRRDAVRCMRVKGWRQLQGATMSLKHNGKQAYSGHTGR